MNNMIVQDVAEVYLKDLTSDTVYFFGLTTKAEIIQKIMQEFLRGGIGNGVAGVIQSNKEISFNVATLFHNDDLLAVQSGSSFTSQSIDIMKTEVVKLAGGKLALTGEPKSGTSNVVVFDAQGKKFEGTFATGDVTITGGTDGKFYTVLYPQTVTAQALSLDSKLFPKNYYVELHTIAYNPETNIVGCDIYWSFVKALPDGNFTEALEAGKTANNEVTFTAQLPEGSSEYGKYLVVPRA